MSEKDLYQQKMKAQLDEWKADVDKLRAKASGASADAKLKLDQQVKDLEARIEEGKAKLAELADASEEAWDSVKEGIESAWGSLKSAVKDAAAKFKE
jgi:DNA-binding transcriptional regulator GbsR (MarR family)